MFSFFRRRKAPPQGCSIYINGHLYARVGDDIICIMPDRVRFTCGDDHVAPNGVSITQIACSLAAIEGLVHIRLGTAVGRFDRSRIGLN
jgi:hypothetical protein